MTNQADRIEALLVEVSAKLDALLSKRGKKPKVETDSIVKVTMDTLEQVRGYVSTMYGAEAKAVKEMAKLGYTPNDILECYTALKGENFWKDKALTTMRIKSHIGEWKKNQEPTEDKYEKQNVPPRRVK